MWLTCFKRTCSIPGHSFPCIYCQSDFLWKIKEIDPCINYKLGTLRPHNLLPYQDTKFGTPYEYALIFNDSAILSFKQKEKSKSLPP